MVFLSGRPAFFNVHTREFLGKLGQTIILLAGVQWLFSKVVGDVSKSEYKNNLYGKSEEKAEEKSTQ